MQKAKVKCRAQRTGPTGVQLAISVKAPDFGKFDGTLKYKLSDQKLGDIVLEKAVAAQVALDGMEIDDNGVAEYLGTCNKLLADLLAAIQEYLD